MRRRQNEPRVIGKAVDADLSMPRSCHNGAVPDTSRLRLFQLVDAPDLPVR